eukprot:scaffold24994_cov42-Phaeocystis_antarctica.AAC.1
MAIATDSAAIAIVSEYRQPLASLAYAGMLTYYGCIYLLWAYSLTMAFATLSVAMLTMSVCITTNLPLPTLLPGKKSKKTITVALSALEGAACMNNTFCLAIFMGLCYFKQLACATY